MMVDENGIRTEFMFLLSDRRDERRREAAGRIAGSGVPGAGTLAEAGLKIASVLHEGGRPEVLAEALDALRKLPMTDYWHPFIEAAGEAVLGRAIAGPAGPRKELLRHGLEMVAMALSSGFPVSNHTMELVEQAKADGELAASAGFLIEKNSALMPHGEALRAFRKKATQPGKERGKAAR